VEFSVEVLPHERALFWRAQRRLALMEEAKKCEFFVPPTHNVRCDHCNMGDGLEGTCRLYEGTHDSCPHFKDKKRIARAKAVLKKLTEAERKEVLKGFL